MQSEGNAVYMQREWFNYASAYCGIASIPLSPVYYTHTTHGNRGMQYAEGRECSMQSEGNAVCRVRVMQSERNGNAEGG